MMYDDEAWAEEHVERAARVMSERGIGPGVGQRGLAACLWRWRVPCSMLMPSPRATWTQGSERRGLQHDAMDRYSALERVRVRRVRSQ